MRFRENGLWLMSELNFMPDIWGGIGFHTVGLQCRIAHPRTIVAIYNTRDSENVDLQGMVVSFVELSGETGDICQFVRDDILRERRAIDGNENRWPYAVEISRAWMVTGTNSPIVANNWQDVEYIFSNTYTRDQGRPIGTFARMVETQNPFDRIGSLEIEAVRVYQQDLPLEEYATARDLLTSRGVLLADGD